MKVLIACECSQVVCLAFRARGHESYSCDIEECYGGHPEYHIQGDCLSIIHENTDFITMDGHVHTIDKWDLVIAHPPCTYLCRCQAPLYNIERYGHEKVSARKKRQAEAIDFFMALTKIQSPLCIENPVGIMSRIYRKPDQIIQPFWFGDAATKATCLWLYGLPKLKKTNIVDPPPRHYFPKSNAMGGWYYQTSCLPPKQRARARSRTFDGIAEAMAYQWG